MEEALRALVADDERTVRTYLKHVTESEGFRTRVVADGRRGLEVFERFHPHLVLADVRMPGMDGLALLEAIRRRDRRTIVILITADQRAEPARRALRIGANGFLRKPIHHVELVMVVRKYAEMLAGAAAHGEIAGSVARETLTLALDNRMDLISPAADYLVEQAGEALAPEDRLGVRLGLVELLTNAIEHGNLGITFEEKRAAMEEGGDAYERLRDARLTDPTRAGRRVTVEFRLDETACEWVIRDEGEGFDAHRFLAQAEGENLLACNGRGILLTLIHFDELEYLGRGNAVRVRKRRRRCGEVSSVSA